jgi:uncharacterized protein with FMN-binding domain
MVLNKSQKTARVVFAASLGIIGFIVLAVLGAWSWFNLEGIRAEKSLGGFKPDTAALADGEYTGAYKGISGTVLSEVSFTIVDDKLTGVVFPSLLTTPGYKTKDEVTGRIIDGGDLRFDAVTGATRTSSLARAAIKDAVEKGPIAESNK